MKNVFFIAVLSLTLMACSNNTNSGETKIDSTKLKEQTNVKSTDSIKKQQSAESLKAKNWLTEVIESHFNNGKFPMKAITTKEYNAYKEDALSLVYDNPGNKLDEKGFQKKWESKYNTKYAGIGSGFLISGQDYGKKIKVTTCDLTKQTEEPAYYFKVVIDDIDFKVKYNRDIKVIRSGDQFLIDDILEYD